MKAVIYARYSSDNQREESIDGQIRECTAFAEKNGITILRHYIDRACSAKTDNRPAFQEMVKDSVKKLFDMVIVWKLDRFARNRYDSARYKAQLKKNGVKVVSATEVISEGAEGIILESVLEGYAEYYSADLSEKVIRGRTDNALKCMYNGGTLPIGFVIDEEQHFQIDPLTAPFVLEVFKRYDEGATMKELRDWLNENGIRNKLGKPLNYNSIQHMLKNRRYIGEYQYRDVLIPDGIPAIVPKELFDRVQEKIEKNKKAPARHKAEDDYLLTTKLFCGYCGAYLCGESGKSRNGTIHHYYKCVSVKKKRTDCKKKPVRKQWLEDLVVNEVMKVVMDDQAIEAIVSMVMDLQDRENTNLPLYEQQLQEAQRGIDNLLNAIQQGILTKSTKTHLEELEATKEDLEIKIANEKIAKPRISPEFVTFWLHKFRKLDVRQQSHRKMLIDAFVNAIYLYDDKMVITFNYKDGTRTIALDDVKKAVKKNTGSDLDCFAAPYRVFLQHLKGCKNTRFLYSEFTGGVVDDYAFSCIYGHFRDRQGQHRWNLNRSDAVIVDAKPLLPYAIDLLRIEYFDLLNQFVQHPGRQFPRSGVLADKTDKHICRHGTAALLLYFGAELGKQLLLIADAVAFTFKIIVTGKSFIEKGGHVTGFFVIRLFHKSSFRQGSRIANILVRTHYTAICCLCQPGLKAIYSFSLSDFIRRRRTLPRVSGLSFLKTGSTTNDRLPM